MELGLSFSEILPLAIALLISGIVMGLLAGLLGIGGGGILVPILYEVFGIIGVADTLRMHLAVGTALAIIIPTSLRSFFSHKAHGAVDMELVRSLAFSVIFGVLIGIVIAKYSNDTVLKWVWAVVAGSMSLKLYFGREDWRLGEVIPGQPYRGFYGSFIGIISTLMSIGGGVFITTLMTLYGRPIHQAVATSSAFGPLIAVPGTIGFVWAGWRVEGLPPGSLGFVNLLGAALIIPVSVIAAPLGVRLAHGISKRRLEFAFATFLALVSLRYFWNLI